MASHYTTTQAAPTMTKGETGITSSLISKLTVGSLSKMSTVSKRSNAVPLESLFKADIESVKSKNERRSASGLEGESQKFGRWAQRNGPENVIQRSNSGLQPIAEVQRQRALA